MDNSLLKEQFVIIFTTTFSLLTAWAWDSVFKQYIKDKFGDGLNVSIIYAIIITSITFVGLYLFIRYLKIDKNKLEEARKVNDLGRYVTEQITIPKKY